MSDSNNSELREHVSKTMGYWAPTSALNGTGFDAYPERVDTVIALINEEMDKAKRSCSCIMCEYHISARLTPPTKSENTGNPGKSQTTNETEREA